MPEPSGSLPSQRGPSRRSMLKGIAGTAAFTAVPGAVLAACSSSGGNKGATSSSGGAAGATTPAAGGSISFGSNYSDPSTKSAFAALVDAAKTSTGVNISINTVDHNTFQDNISSYLQGTPNDLATWFAGYRLQYFAAQNLLDPIDDVWDKIGPNFGDAAKNLSKGADGRYYLVPLYNYPWVVFYNKSTFAKNGYTVPKTWDDFIALCKQMQKRRVDPARVRGEGRLAGSRARSTSSTCGSTATTITSSS